ncbi:hypothetical protein ILUMI_03998 [Ignelater luminosus]|uniref:Transposase Tc1-like domain-containing protein n=1 Tax=Ignelater luminosus TaxID=2038154 RepID=A0A8K0GJF2_IGNLU|nr:hypothetical protein ILUMI_03998 [Ignelater luminosus]
MILNAEDCAKAVALVEDGRSQRRHLTSVETKNQLHQVLGTEVSVWTVRRRLRDVDLKACRPASGPKLLRRRRVARLQFDLEFDTVEYYTVY